jgi:hypothetical protein
VEGGGENTQSYHGSAPGKMSVRLSTTRSLGYACPESDSEMSVHVSTTRT